MQVNLIKWMNVVEVIGNDKAMQKAFFKFYEKLKGVDWNTPNDMLSTFNSADIVKCNPSSRVIFNIGGNKYRLICGYYFAKMYIDLFVKFVGTHHQYDKIDICQVNMFKK